MIFIMHIPYTHAWPSHCFDIKVPISEWDTREELVNQCIKADSQAQGFWSVVSITHKEIFLIVFLFIIVFSTIIYIYKKYKTQMSK
jgi:hypothetical protein